MEVLLLGVVGWFSGYYGMGALVLKIRRWRVRGV
jgi:hypothetical protein